MVFEFSGIFKVFLGLSIHTSPGQDWHQMGNLAFAFFIRCRSRFEILVLLTLKSCVVIQWNIMSTIK